MKCPICMNEANNDGDTCSVCGYHFEGATQQFAAITVDTEGTQATSEEVSVPTLTMLYGKQEGLVFKLDSDLVQLGRSPKCGVMLNDMTVSRVHAEIAKINGEWVITDCDSFNGVWVNNQAVKQAVLHNGDLLQVGCFVIRFSE